MDAHFYAVVPIIPFLHVVPLRIYQRQVDDHLLGPRSLNPIEVVIGSHRTMLREIGTFTGLYTSA
jgi:hypothetical protein